MSDLSNLFNLLNLSYLPDLPTWSNLPNVFDISNLFTLSNLSNLSDLSVCSTSSELSNFPHLSNLFDLSHLDSTRCGVRSINVCSWKHSINDKNEESFLSGLFDRCSMSGFVNSLTKSGKKLVKLKSKITKSVVANVKNFQCDATRWL